MNERGREKGIGGAFQSALLAGLLYAALTIHTNATIYEYVDLVVQ